MKMLSEYAPSIILIMFLVAVLAVQCLRSAWRKPQRPIVWDNDWTKDAREDVLAHRSQKDEPVLDIEDWIAGAIAEDFDEEMEELAKEGAPLSEPVSPKRMLLTDANTGQQMDLGIEVLVGEDGKEVADLHKATDALCKDGDGQWWDVSLKDFSWDCPTIH